MEEKTSAILLPSELGKILGVDCVVMGTFETSKPMLDAAGIAIAPLFGSLMSTNNAVCNLDFYDTRDDELVVNYLKKYLVHLVQILKT